MSEAKVKVVWDLYSQARQAQEPQGGESSGASTFGPFSSFDLQQQSAAFFVFPFHLCCALQSLTELSEAGLSEEKVKVLWDLYLQARQAQEPQGGPPHKGSG